MTGAPVPTIAIALTNDTAGRLISVATTMPGLSGAKTTAYTLDAGGNRTKLTWPDGYYATYSYDSLNRMVTVADSVSVSYLATYSYDTFSRRTNLAYGNGAGMGYGYTTAGDLTSLTNTLNGPSYNLAYTLGYTGAHELNSEAFSNLAYSYQPQIGTDAYAAVNVLNQYPSVTPAGQGAQSIGYDGNGNLASGGGWTYGYDAENKLMTASNGSSVSAAYAYDPLGRRTQKSGTGVAQTLFLNDGSDEIAEYNSAGTVLRRFVPGSAINEPVAYENCANATAPNCTGSGMTTEYIHTDHHGSVIATSGTSAAPVEGPFTYDSYGNGAPLSGEPFKYVGMYLDAETGLYYDRARYYSSSLGRFLQTDPIGYKDDLDLYTYVGNDPTDKTDPTGELAISCSVNEGSGGSATVDCTSHDDGQIQTTVKVTVTHQDGSVTSTTKTYSNLDFGTFANYVLGGAGYLNSSTYAAVNRDIQKTAGIHCPSGDCLNRHDNQQAASPAAQKAVDDVLDRTSRGISDPHRNDGSIFENREGRLPTQPRGYYREYVVRTPGASGPGSQRVILGANGEAYYTADHYVTFEQVR